MSYIDSFDGDVSKMQSEFEKIYLPPGPLLYLDVGIKLRNLDQELEEYPKPKPVAYASYDRVPNEHHHDFKVSLESKNARLISTKFPVQANFLIVRIDGGLLDEFHMFNAYTVRGWKYTIYINAKYCPSGTFTVLPFNYSRSDVKFCQVPIGNIEDEFDGFKASLIYVSERTSKLTVVGNSNYSIQAGNYATDLVSGEKVFLFPKPGWWYFIGNYTNGSDFQVVTENCEINKTTTCLGQTVDYINHVSTYEQIKENIGYADKFNETVIHLQISIMEDDIKYRYAVNVKSLKNRVKSLSYSVDGLSKSTQLCSSYSKNYCKKDSMELVAEIEYAKLGSLYVTIEMALNETFYYTVYRTRIGKNMCHSQPFEEYDDIVYSCYCLQNTGGFYCETDAISDSRYWTAIMFLTLSNLTMLLAVVYGFRIKAYVEITAYGANMIASYIYHWCDEQYYCFGFSSYSLRVIDFILSFYSVCVSIIYLAKLTNLKLKFSLLLAILITLMYLGLGSGFNMFETSILVIFI